MYLNDLRNCGIAELRNQYYIDCVRHLVYQYTLNISMYSNDLRNCGIAELRNSSINIISFNTSSIIYIYIYIYKFRFKYIFLFANCGIAELIVFLVVAINNFFIKVFELQN